MKASDAIPSKLLNDAPRRGPWRLLLPVSLACFIVGWLKCDFARPLAPSRARRRRLDSVYEPPHLTEKHHAEVHGLAILAENEYTNTAPARHPLWRIIEPHRETALIVVDDYVTSEERASVSYSWSVSPATAEGEADQDVAPQLLGIGKVTSHFFELVGNVVVSVHASACPGCSDERAHTARQYGEFFAVRYVRRELRTLTAVDAKRFFDAAETLYRVPALEGRARYGDRYQDITHFVARHMRFGARKDCDHWHEGPGFVTSHVAFTLEFERALQTVDPAVTVPYWDYTLESTFYTPETWRSSRVFHPDWLGPAAPPNGVITEGRWAYVPTLRVGYSSREFTGEDDLDSPDTTPHNAWGLLRGPWNMNPIPYLTRSATVQGWTENLKPRGCDAFDMCLRMEGWMTLSMCLNTVAHGYLHELMGGSWGQLKLDDDASRRFISAGEMVAEGVYELLHMALALNKELWRASYVTCPDYCAVGTSLDVCRCRCDAEAFAEDGVYEAFRSSGALTTMASIDSNGVRWEAVNASEGEYVLLRRSKADTEAVLTDLLTPLCESGFVGDMYSASSPNDISFWLLHPSLDRLWHRQRLATAGHPVDAEAAAQTGVSPLLEGTRVQGTFDETWEPSHTCFGHNPDDVTPFDSGIFAGVSAGRRLTNAELYELMDPTDSALPYVYDGFRWSHCERLGYEVRK